MFRIGQSIRPLLHNQRSLFRHSSQQFILTFSTMSSSAQSPVRIIHHYPCPDGVFAALAAHLRFRAEPERDVRFVPGFVTSKLQVDENPTFTSETEVYLLDFSGGCDTIQKLCAKCKTVNLLDHHKTAQDDLQALRAAGELPPNLNIEMDMSRSGAMIAWDYFGKQKSLMPEGEDKTRVQRMFDFIQDIDIWAKKIVDSDCFSVGLANLRLEYDVNKNPEIFNQLLALQPEELIQQGKLKMAERDVLIAADIANSYEIEIPFPTPTRCLCTETVQGELRSELGNRLAIESQKRGLTGMAAVIYKDDALGPLKWKVSLRSIPEVDASAVAKHFGGGGHKNAASFNLEVEEVSKWKEAGKSEKASSSA